MAAVKRMMNAIACGQQNRRKDKPVFHRKSPYVVPPFACMVSHRFSGWERDGMILAGHDELHPDGTGLLTLWEWQSGTPYVEMQGQPPMMQESSMNTTTKTSEPSPTVMQ
jgi:hypothetical protein